MSRFFRALAPLAALVLLAIPVHAASPVPLQWLEGTPKANIGINFGTPWPQGAVPKTANFTLANAAGQTVPVQSWPLAYWPDGSLKWSGHAISSGAGVAGPFQISVTAAAVPPVNPLRAVQSDTGIDIETGGPASIHAHFPKTGSSIIDALFVGSRKVAQDGRLIVQTEDRSQQAQGILRYVNFTSSITKVTLEQAGPIRAVVKVEGVEVTDKPAAGEVARSWLPFTMRFYFYAGSGGVRIVHSFIFDGDQQKDFIKGMGLSFSVPFAEETHNRHVRLAGETGMWCQPVRLIPGYRNALPEAQYQQYLAGQRMPNLADMAANMRTATQSVAIYNDMKLTQLGPNDFSIDKRTSPDASWLHVVSGTRSPGLALLGDVSGGIAIGIKDFWQKYPAELEIRNAASPVGTLTAWLWSPDAPAMDMRTYDDVPHGLATNYEDWKPGWGTATGIAHTTDIVLWAFAAIPSDADLAIMAQASAPPVLVSTPEYYHAQHVFGLWSLPDRSTPTLSWVEDQLDQLWTFYHNQVNERAWYGFYDYGDIMHNYDFGRHDWRYDIGGWAWANTELMPDMFLWYTFLRTGRADAYRMAEAMTRHTSETDVYHIGPFAPLGSRHNVNHWGDGAKQPRISHAMLKRYMYYFSGGDERLGDLMDEQLDADLTYSKLQQFNGSHYVLSADGTPTLDRGATAAPTPDQLVNIAPRAGGGRGGAPIAQSYADGKPMEARYANANFNLEWICYSINWATKYERTGDPIWRDRVLAGMKTIVARSNGGPLGSNYFDIIFGGPEILFDEKPMFDYPEFWNGVTKVFESVSASGGNQMTGPRGAAYAAYALKSQDYGILAWQDLVGNAQTDIPIRQNAAITSPNVLHPVTDPVFLGGSAGWQLHGVASIQWALNALETTELAKPYVKAYESGAQPAAGIGRNNAGGRGRGGGGRGVPATAPATQAGDGG